MIHVNARSIGQENSWIGVKLVKLTSSYPESSVEVTSLGLRVPYKKIRSEGIRSIGPYLVVQLVTSTFPK